MGLLKPRSAGVRVPLIKDSFINCLYRVSLIDSFNCPHLWRLIVLELVVDLKITLDRFFFASQMIKTVVYGHISEQMKVFLFFFMILLVSMALFIQYPCLIT